MAKSKQVLYQMYRDESNAGPLEKVAALAARYAKKKGLAPSVIGVPPGFPDEVRAQLRERFDVRVVVPAWAMHEIWLGQEVGDVAESA